MSQEQTYTVQSMKICEGKVIERMRDIENADGSFQGGKTHERGDAELDKRLEPV